MIPNIITQERKEWVLRDRQGRKNAERMDICSLLSLVMLHT